MISIIWVIRLVMVETYQMRTVLVHGRAEDTLFNRIMHPTTIAGFSQGLIA
jgi:hypothetical protein